MNDTFNYAPLAIPKHHASPPSFLLPCSRLSPPFLLVLLLVLVQVELTGSFQTLLFVSHLAIARQLCLAQLHLQLLLLLRLELG